MKSLQVEMIVPKRDQKNFSELQVLRSGAGFYIGTIYTDPKTKFQEPGSRDSDYFEHKEQAEQALAKLELFWAYESNPDCIDLWEKWLTMEELDPRNIGYRIHP